MNTLTSDEWEDLSAHLATAKKALNDACEILDTHNLDTDGFQTIGDYCCQSHTACSNALWLIGVRKNRLRKEAKEVTE